MKATTTTTTCLIKDVVRAASRPEVHIPSSRVALTPLYICPFSLSLMVVLNDFFMCSCFTLFIEHKQVCFFKLIQDVLYLSEAAFRSLECCALAHFNC